MKLLGAGETAEVFAWGEGKVLKLYHKYSRKRATQELRCSRLCSRESIPTPKAEELIEVEGRIGVVFERVEGVSILESLLRRPWRLVSLAKMFAETHLSIHRCDASSLPSAIDEIVSLIEREPNLSESLQQATLNYLAESKKEGASRNKLCHGDFHPDNVLVSSRTAYVIDWGTAVVGDPMADVAQTYLILRHGKLPEALSPMEKFLINRIRRAFAFVYLRHYMNRSGVSEDAWQRWLWPLAAAQLSAESSFESQALSRIVEKAAG